HRKNAHPCPIRSLSARPTAPRSGPDACRRWRYLPWREGSPHEQLAKRCTSWRTAGSRLSPCLHHPIDRDPSLAELADMPQGWYAERAKMGEPWVRRKHEAEEGSEEVAALF